MTSLYTRVALVGRNKSALESVASQCREAGAGAGAEAGAGDVVVSVRDLSVEEECVLAVKDTVETYGGINVLVNCAGILLRSDFASVTMEEIDLSMQVNLKSALKLSQECLPYLVVSRGNIVNVSSIAGLRAYPGAMSYKLSKAAMDQLTRCTALEVASQGVRVNSVNPGVIDTDIFLRSGMSQADYEQYLETSRSLHPLGRPGTVEEVAKAIAFLASEDASFITGQTLAVDGGRSIAIPSASYTST